MQAQVLELSCRGKHGFICVNGKAKALQDGLRQGYLTRCKAVAGHKQEQIVQINQTSKPSTDQLGGQWRKVEKLPICKLRAA